MKNHQHGQSLTEYGLILVAVLVVAIVGLTSLAESVVDGFGGMLGNSKTPTTTQVSGIASVNNPSVAGTTTPAQLCSTAEQCAALGSSMDLKSTVQVAGANGTIKVMSDKIRLMASQLLANNEITPAQAGLFNDLANQGYRIGKISGLVEQTAESCGSDADCFNGTSVSFEGKPYTMQDLGSMIGYKPLSPTDQTVTANSPEVDSLWSIYQSLPPTVWSDSAVKDTVTTLTTQIGSTSNLVMWGVTDISNGYMSPNGMQDYLVTKAQGTIPQSGLAQGETAQASTSQDSGTVCTSGNGTTNGITCD